MHVTFMCTVIFCQYILISYNNIAVRQPTYSCDMSAPVSGRLSLCSHGDVSVLYSCRRCMVNLIGRQLINELSRMGRLCR